MGVTEIIALTVLGFFAVILLLKLFSRPLSFVLKLLLNTALGAAAMGLVNLLTPYIGLHIPLNGWTALTVGILGVPGFVLLFLLQWVL